MLSQINIHTVDMAELVKLRTKDRTVAALQRLREKYIDGLETPLEIAAKSGDIDQFNKAFAQMITELRNTCLHCRRDKAFGECLDLEMSFAAIFSHAGSRLQCRDPTGVTVGGPLPSLDEIQYLVPDNVLDRRDLTIVEMLPNCGIGPNKCYSQPRISNRRNEAFRTAFHAAARFSDAGICSLLIAHGAEPALETSVGETSLQLAIPNLDRDQLESLCPKTRLLEKTNHSGRTPLLQACASPRALGYIYARLRLTEPERNLSVTESLAIQHSKIHAKDHEGKTALHGTVCQLNVAPTEWMLDAGLR